MNEIENYKRLVEEGRYYEAHEALEELWFPIRKTKSNFSLVLKGFINAAVSMELYKRGKRKQSYKIFLVYKKYVNMTKINDSDKPEEFKVLKKFIDSYFVKIQE